jgi:hypothetical protein
LVKKSHIFIGILHKVLKIVLNDLITKRVVAFAIGALAFFTRTASYYFTQAYDVWVGEIDYCFEIFRGEI